MRDANVDHGGMECFVPGCGTTECGELPLGPGRTTRICAAHALAWSRSEARRDLLDEMREAQGPAGAIFTLVMWSRTEAVGRPMDEAAVDELTALWSCD